MACNTLIKGEGDDYKMKKNRKSLKLFMSFVTMFILGSCFNPNSAEAKPGDDYCADKAISYADSCFRKKGDTYVKVPNSKYGDDLCTGYVSQCLREGGMETDSKWYWKSRTNTSESWRLCSSLYSYMRDCGYNINYSPSASDVKPGDVVFYYREGRWGHVAICTGKTSKGVPYVNAYNNPHYHYTNWTMGYKTCVVSMETRTSAPKITEQITKSGRSITMTSSTKDSTIYYTTNGKVPTTSSTKYKKRFNVKKNCTIKAFAINKKYPSSKVTSISIDVDKSINNGTYYICAAEKNTLALGINNSSKDKLAKVNLMPASSQEYNRKFKVKYLGKGKYTFTALHSGMNLSEVYVDTPASNKTASAKAADIEQTHTASGAATSTDKTLSATNPSTSASISTGAAITAPTEVSTSSVVEIEPNSSSNKKSLICQTDDNNAYNKWQVQLADTNKFYLKNSDTNNYLSILTSLKNGASANVSGSKKKNGQIWSLSKASTSKMKITLYQYPKTIKSGNSKISLSGFISSNYDILSVKISIVNSSTNKTVCSTSSKSKSRKVYLYALGQKLNIKNLSSGKYKLKINACDASKQTKTLINKQFSIK